MTRIDFYQLPAQPHNHDRVVCQLCQKAYESNQFTLLLTQTPEQTAYLDRLLWIFNDDSFVPHDVLESDDFKSPVLIQNEAEPRGDRQLLINLNNSIPGYFAQFERVIELVTEDNKQQARQHYSYYKERGYPLKHYNL
jgi:DNA polymerase-3 subunit chi